ncbi:hypothetical protein KCU81_g118, partial [Aureobasidium melanogenum]
MVVGSVLEDTDLGTSDNERAVVFVANSELRVDVSILISGDNIIFRLITVVVLAPLSVVILLFWIIVFFFLLFVFFTSLGLSLIILVLQDEVIESIKDVVSLGILCLEPLGLVRVLPESLHQALLELLQRFPFLETQKP